VTCGRGSGFLLGDHDDCYDPGNQTADGLVMLFEASHRTGDAFMRLLVVAGLIGIWSQIQIIRNRP